MVPPTLVVVPAGTTAEAITATWRAESTRLVGALTRMTRSIQLAEDLAQDALVAALEQWPEKGVPDNPAAWLMTTAKRRGVDAIRRAENLRRKQEREAAEAAAPEDSSADNSSDTDTRV